MPGQDDLLLRVQSDVAKAIADLDALNRAVQTGAGVADRWKAALTGTSLAVTSTGRAVSDTTQVVRQGKDIWTGFFDVIKLLPPSLQSAIGAIGAARLAAATLGAGLSVLTRITLDQATTFGHWANEIVNISKETSLAVDTVQAMRIRVAELGMSQEVATMAMRRFALVIQEVDRGTGRAADIFQRFKIAVRDGSGNLRKSEAILTDLAKAIASIENESTRAAVTQEIWGTRIGARLLPFILDIATGTKDWSAVLKEASMIMGDDAVKAGKDFDSSLSAVNQRVSALRRNLGSFLAEVLNPFVKQMAALKPAELGNVLAQVTVPTQIIAQLRDLITQYTAESARLLGLRKTNDIWSPETGLKRDEIPAVVAAAKQLTEPQRKRLEESAKLNAQANIQAATGEAERLRGKKAALDKAFELEQTENKRELAEAIAAAKREAGEREAAVEELESIEGAFRTKLEAKRIAHNDAVAALEKEQGKQLGSIAIDAEERKLLAVQALRKVDLGQRRDMFTISESEYLRQVQAVEDREYEIRSAAQKKRITLLVESPDIEGARKKQEQLDLEHTQRTQENAAAITRTLREESDKQREILWQTQLYWDDAFGSPAQKQLHELTQQFEELRRKLNEVGAPQGELDKLGQAYARKVADLKGVTLDLTSTIKTGIDDAFSGIILGTRKMDDVFKAFKESMVKQFTSAFTEALLKKLDFDTKFRINMTEDLPASAAQGGSGIVKNISAAFDLLSGGSGVGRGATINDGLASWVGGPPSATSANQAARLAQIGLGPSDIASLQSGVLAPSGAAGGVVQTGGAGFSLASLGVGGNAGLLSLSLALSQRGGTLGQLGTLGALYSGVSLAGELAPVLGLGSFTAVGGTGLAALGATGTGSLFMAGLPALAQATRLASLGLTASEIGALQGGALAGTAGSTAGSTGLSAAVSGFAPYLGAAVGVAGFGLQAYSAERAVSIGGPVALNASANTAIGAGGGAAGGAAIGTLIAPGLGTVIGAALGAIVGGILGSLGAKGPLPHTQGLRIAKKLFGLPEFGQLQRQYSPVGPHGMSIVNEEFTTSPGYGYRGGAQYEKSRGLLEAESAMLLSSSNPSKRGTYRPSDLHEFASTFIRDATNTGQSVRDFKAEVGSLAQMLGGKDLMSAMSKLERLFQPSWAKKPWFSTDPEFRKIYAKGIAEVAAVYVSELPRAAKDVIEQMASDGILAYTKLKDYIDDVLVGTQAAVDGIKAAMDAVLTATDAEAIAQEKDTKRAFDLSQATHESRLSMLDLEIEQAQLYGDTITAADLKMQRGAELAAKDAAKRAEDKRRQDVADAADPGKAFAKAVRLSMRDAVVTGITDALVTSGIVQVALAPFFKALKEQADVLSDPNATQAEIDIAMNAIDAAAAGARVSVNAALPRVTDILNSGAVTDLLGSFNEPALAAGGIITRPMRALLGEAGPEAVIPLTRVHGLRAAQRGAVGGDGVYVTVNLQASVLDERLAPQLARLVGSGILRELKHNSMIG